MSEFSLFKALTKINDEKVMQKFLLDLCTPAELKAMSERWRVAQMLKLGISYRQINEETGVSTATITRVARSVNEGSGYRQLLKD